MGTPNVDFRGAVADQPRARLANGRKRQDASASVLIAIPVTLTQIRKIRSFLSQRSLLRVTARD